MRPYFSLLAFLLWAGLVAVLAPLRAQQPTDFTWFDSDTVLPVEIRVDLRALSRTDKDYVKADFVALLPNGPVAIPVRLRARGAFRKNFCSMPPVRMKLDQDRLKDSGLKSVMDVKMVTQCKPPRVYDTYLALEYLTYQLYATLSPYHFRTRMLEVNWIDVRKPKKPAIQQHAFIIEDIDQAAARHQCRIIEAPGVRYQEIDRRNLVQFSLFQYMIGNTDWNIGQQHNLKILQPLSKGINAPLLVVPYDFDYSGLVNASYAVPGDQMIIKSVRDRLYMGPCMELAELTVGIKDFMVQKSQFWDLITGSLLLTEREKAAAIQYLEKYFELATTPNSLRKKIAPERVPSGRK